MPHWPVLASGHLRSTSPTDLRPTSPIFDTRFDELIPDGFRRRQTGISHPGIAHLQKYQDGKFIASVQKQETTDSRADTELLALGIAVQG